MNKKIIGSITIIAFLLTMFATFASAQSTIDVASASLNTSGNASTRTLMAEPVATATSVATATPVAIATATPVAGPSITVVAVYKVSEKKIVITGTSSSSEVFLAVTQPSVTTSPSPSSNAPYRQVFVNVTSGAYSYDFDCSSVDLLDGSYSIQVKNTSDNKSATVSVQVDKTGPVITFNKYITTPTNKDITVTATTKDGKLNFASKKFTKNGSFEFVATDLVGNVTKKIVAITNIDKTAPVIKGLGIKNNGYTKAKSVTISAKDSNGVLYSVTRYSKAYKWPARGTFKSSGNYIVTVKDKAGNSSKFNFKIDRSAPVVTIKNSSKRVVKSGTSIKTKATITIADQIAYTLTTYKNTKKINNLKGGVFTSKGSYKVVAKDKIGNSRTVSFKIV